MNAIQSVERILVLPVLEQLHLLVAVLRLSWPHGIIVMLGSPLNSRDYLIETASAASVTVSPAIVSTESAGATIQIYEG